MGLQWRASVVINPLTASWSTPRQHGGLTCKSTGRTRRQLRGDRRGYSRPARRDVPPAGVWCVPGWPVTIPSVVCHTRNARIDVGLEEGPGRFDPDRRTKSQLLLSLSYER